MLASVSDFCLSDGCVSDRGVGTCVSDMCVLGTGASGGVCQIGVSDRHVGLVCQMCCVK